MNDLAEDIVALPIAPLLAKLTLAVSHLSVVTEALIAGRRKTAVHHQAAASAAIEEITTTLREALENHAARKQ